MFINGINISGVRLYRQARVLPSGPDKSIGQVDRRSIRKAEVEGEQESHKKEKNEDRHFYPHTGQKKNFKLV